MQTLSARHNRLEDIPASCGNLSTLKRLDLSGNPLRRIPPCIFDLRHLKNLELSDCQITAVPPDIVRLDGLQSADFSGNPIDSPPLEVTAKGLKAIRNYWRQREAKGVDYLCEAKLIILGEPGAGKTSLARKIKNRAYKLRERQKSTEGIDVIKYSFPTAIRTTENGTEKLLKRKFQVNIWDFGGQEIYHATHQFFLTKRSVYVLVCDDRKEDTDFSYWLHVVEMLSDASPLLIVQNEKQDRTRDINLSALRARFPNLRVALATNLDTNRGLDEVIQAIRKELEGLAHVGVGLPATWKRVREALEADKRNYLSLDTYLAVCEGHGFERRDDKLQLSGYLHDLGICLHFQDDAVLKNIVILKPAWGTDAVYRVLDDAEVIANRGQFTKRDLARIWSDEKYRGMQDELLQLMMKFQLCYALAAKNQYIAPQLLSSEQPRYAWDTTDGLVLQYEYSFMPKGILTRFVVATHHLISEGRLVWKTGVVLERDGARAEVIEDYAHRRIRVRMSGANARGLLAIVDDQIERLHASFPRLQYDRLLPCPCSECREKAEPFAFALKMLERMASKSHSIQCHVSAEMIDADALVRDVLPHVLQQRAGNTPVEARSLAPAADLMPEVFVSYAWTDESCGLVDRVQQAMAEKGIRVLRDREEIRYKDSIREFMKRIGRGKAVIVVISDKYLKSEYCMFELVQAAKMESLRERIFPIVLSDADLKATGRARYVKHWEAKIKELDGALKEVQGDNLQGLQGDLTDYAEIRRMFDGLAGVLKDMNAMTPDWHVGKGLEEFVKRVRGALGGA
ncbi:MAG: COR domain-containing protein [Gammaproteobacteria bacterium]